MSKRSRDRIFPVSGGSSADATGDVRKELVASEPHAIGGEETQDGLSVIDAEGTEWLWVFRSMTPRRPVQTFEFQDVDGPKGPVLPADKAVTVFYVAASKGPDGNPALWGTTRLGWRFLMSDMLRAA
jgi:hypothetical protein